jgi:membrane protein involved in colicin uptake
MVWEINAEELEEGGARERERWREKRGRREMARRRNRGETAESSKQTRNQKQQAVGSDVSSSFKHANFSGNLWQPPRTTHAILHPV